MERRIQYGKIDNLFGMLVDQGYIPGECVHMCKGCQVQQYGKFDKSTFLRDTGALTHMVPDEGMYNWKEINEPVIVGDGKALRAVKIGKI